MENEMIIMNFVDKFTESEILKLRENYNGNKNLKKYLYKTLNKIFRKLIFPYFRFEVLLKCILDVIENNKYYPEIDKKQIKKINILYKRLQRICLYLNLASDELNKVVIKLK